MTERASKVPLVDRMLARADADNLPATHQLRTLSAALREATAGFYAEPQTVKVRAFMGCWARARRAWCDHTGESLV